MTGGGGASPSLRFASKQLRSARDSETVKRRGQLVGNRALRSVTQLRHLLIALAFDQQARDGVLGGREPLDELAVRTRHADALPQELLILGEQQCGTSLRFGGVLGVSCQDQ